MVGFSNQYNHFLYVLVPGVATRDENGDYEAEDPSWKLWGMCREETNGKGTYVVIADKGLYQYSSLIQLPSGTPYIPDGTDVVVSDEELDVSSLTRTGIQELIREGRVRIAKESAKFDVGRLHCRMWL